MNDLKNLLKKTLSPSLIAVVCFILTLIFSNLSFERAEILMLDFKQNLFPLNPKDSNIQIVNLDINDMTIMSSSETSAESEFKFPFSFIEQKIEKILSEQPKLLLLMVSPLEIDFQKNDEERLLSLLSQNQNFYLYSKTVTNSPHPPKKEYKTFPKLRDHIKNFEFAYFDDRAYPPYDQSVRRMLIGYEKPTWRLDGHFEDIINLFSIKTPAEHLEGCYSYWDTRQCLLRLSDTSSDWFQSESKVSYKSLRNKIVLLSTHNTYTYFISKSPFWRPKANTSHDSISYPNSLLLASYLDNLMNNHFVIPVSLVGNQVWLFLVLFSLILSLYYLHPKKMIAVFFLNLSIVFFVPILAFAVKGYHLGMIPQMLVCTIVGLIFIPWRFHRFMTSVQKNELEATFEKQMVSTRAKLLTQSVVYETKNKLYLRLLHDLASPIFALKVVSKNMDNKGLGQELKILNGAIERFEKLSAELRGNKNNEHQDENLYNLTSGCKEIIKIFKETFKEVHFIFQAPPEDIYCEFDKFVFERSLSNLLKNSVEALEKEKSESKVVLLQIQNHENTIEILVNDAGPGIPEQIQQRLFQMGATFGKATGSGIGLNQVKDDLESRGATIQLSSGPHKGAAFLITVKKSIIQNKISTQGIFILADDDPHFLKYMSSFIPKECEQHLFTDPSKAFDFIRDQSSLGKPLTLITDLFFEKSNLTGIDLLSILSPSDANVKVLVTSLGHLPEILQLGQSVNALVISKAQFARYSFQPV